MKVLSPTTESQTLRIIPREYTSVGLFTVTIEEDGTGIIETITNVAMLDSGNYMSFSCNFTILSEGNMYSLEVKKDDELLYRDKVYCTSQSDRKIKHTLNTNQYKEHSSQPSGQKYIIVGGISEGGGGGPSTGVSVCHNSSEMDATDSIFQAADLYCVTVDGETYDDWYVPSKDDLTQISNNLTLIQIGLRGNTGYQDIEQGGVVDGFIKLKQYFGSTEANAAEAWILALPKTSGSGIGTDLKQPIETVLNYLTEFRPVRFATSEGTLEAGEKYGGGIVGGTTTVGGVSGYLIVSPTRITGSRDWSSLGNTVTGATDNTDGKANTDTVLALENA